MMGAYTYAATGRHSPPAAGRDPRWWLHAAPCKGSWRRWPGVSSTRLDDRHEGRESGRARSAAEDGRCANSACASSRSRSIRATSSVRVRSMARAAGRRQHRGHPSSLPGSPRGRTGDFASGNAFPHLRRRSRSGRVPDRVFAAQSAAGSSFPCVNSSTEIDQDCGGERTASACVYSWSRVECAIFTKWLTHPRPTGPGARMPPTSKVAKVSRVAGVEIVRDLEGG
jgi:hypothetical protein